VTEFRQFIVGIVLDISLQHHTDTKRYIDIVKSGLIDFAVKLGLNCGIYVAHPNNHHMPRQQGESVALIDSYTDPEINAHELVLQCLDMVSSQESDEKYIFFITDRFQTRSSYHYKKAVKLNKTRGYGCKIVLIGVGNRYDRRALEKLRSDSCVVAHLDEPQKVGGVITEMVGV
jgi:hypothetical protein